MTFPRGWLTPGSNVKLWARRLVDVGGFRVPGTFQELMRHRLPATT